MACRAMRAVAWLGDEPPRAFGPAASVVLRKGSKRHFLNRLQAFRIGLADPGAGVRNEGVRRPSAPAIGQTRPAVRIGRGQRMVSQSRGSAADRTHPKVTAGRKPCADAPHDDHRKPTGRAVWRPHIEILRIAAPQTARCSGPRRTLSAAKRKSLGHQRLSRLAQSLARAGARVCPDSRALRLTPERLLRLRAPPLRDGEAHTAAVWLTPP
jgi:hypothetical protein